MDDTNTVIVTLVQGRNLRTGHWLDATSDPYVNVRVKGHPETKKRTKVLTDTINPIWNETFRLPFTSIRDELEFHVWSKSGLPTLPNPSLGTLVVSLTAFMEKPERWMKLAGFDRGELLLRVQVPKSDNERWQDLLEKTTVQDLLNKKSMLMLIVCYNTERISSFLELLRDNNLLAAPILDAKSKLFLGFLDAMDIAQQALTASQRYTTAAEMSRHFFDQKLSSLVGADAWPTIRETDTLAKVFNIFVQWRKTNPTDIHRLPVFSANGALVNVLSQVSSGCLTFF
jgi:CBS domain-containing protein